MKNISSLFPEDEFSIPTFASGASSSMEGGDPAATTEPVSSDSPAPIKSNRLPRTLAARKLSSDEFLQRKTQQAMARLAVQNSAGPLQAMFPGWDDERRGVPNPLVRCGLFTAASANLPRADYRDEVVASLSNYTIYYSGTELRQDDLSIWLAIVNMGRHQPIGDPIHFTAYRLINDLGWRLHSQTYASIKSIIERLKFTSVKLSTTDQKSQYAGSLIRDYLFDDTDPTGKTCWTVRLEESIARLFLEDTTTLFEWQIRCKLGRRASLASWLFTFYCTHAEPIPYHIAKIHELCKSEDRQMRSFKSNVRQALEKLIDVGFLSSYAIHNDVIQVTRARRPQNLKLAAA